MEGGRAVENPCYEGLVSESSTDYHSTLTAAGGAGHNNTYEVPGEVSQPDDTYLVVDNAAESQEVFGFD